jgi:hypothetical protein
MLSPEQSMHFTGMTAPKKRTHRGRRSKGLGAKDHHEEAKGHMANASSAATPDDARKHLFKALTSLSRAKGAPVSGQGGDGDAEKNPIDAMC